MNEERTMSLTQIGEHFGGVSRVIAGRWLTNSGLRRDGQPTEMAKRGGFCKQVYDEDRGIWFWVWIASRTLPLLEEFLQTGGKAKGDEQKGAEQS